MGELRELKSDLRDISLLDKICSKLFESPAHSGFYCEPLSQSISEFLDYGFVVLSVDQYYMTLKNSLGKELTFWVANYPYSYGSVNCHTCKYPSWNVVLRLRAIQLEHRGCIINNFIESNRV